MPFDISRFKSTLDRYGGPARAYLYEVTITKQAEPNSAMTGRDLTFFCNNVNFPGIQVENRQFNAVAQLPTSFPGTMASAPLSCGFMVDSDHQILSFFHNWIQRVLNFSTKDGAFGAIGEGEDLQLPYELGYKDEYACTISIKHHATESTGTKYYEVILENAYPFIVGEMNLSWENTNQFLVAPVSFAYDRIYYSSDRTGKQVRANGRGLLETLGDLAGFADVVRQTAKQGRPRSIQDAVNRLNRVRNSYDRLTNFFDG